MAEKNHRSMEDLMPGLHIYKPKLISKREIGGGRKHREYKGFWSDFNHDEK